jgi:pimeloyl-ACP methyl ester carboxylesterase
VITKHRVVSQDGTTIAFDRLGDGPPVVLVAGALQGRASYHPLAEELARGFTVYNYDRRGRGDSGDAAPYAVEREVEDLAAVITEAGGTAAVYGHSSGAGLALHAAARGLPIDKLVLHELPYAFDEDESQAASSAAEAAQLRTMLAENRRADAVAFFLSSIGMPPEFVAGLSQDPAMQANAPTLLYDPYETMSAHSRGGRTPAEQAATVTVPTLTLAGTASPQWMVDTSRRLAEALPHGRLTLLDDQGHIVPPEILTPVLAGFLTEETA